MNNEEKILAILEKHSELLDQISSRLDKVDSRLDTLEESQAEMQDSMAEMQATLTKVAVTQENIVLPRLEALYEGQENLRETLAPKGRVEALEDDVALLKEVIRTHSRDIAELKKAQ